RLDFDPDLVADQHTACLERLIPGESEVATVDARAGGEAHALAAPRVRATAVEAHVERHLSSYVADREVAHQAELRALLEWAAALQAPGAEAQARIALHVQE